MFIKHRDHEPKVDKSAFIAPTAVLVGRVKVGSRSRILYGAVLNSEGARVEVGNCAIICENTVLRATSEGGKDHPLIIGDHVFIGPQSTVLGCAIEPNAYIATGVTILHGAKINSGAVVAVGALVHANTNIPQDFFVPPNTVAVGDPVQIFSPDEKEAMSTAIKAIGFAKVAFDIDAQGKSRAELYKEATEIRSKEFEHHFNDSIIK